MGKCRGELVDHETEFNNYKNGWWVNTMLDTLSHL